MTAFIIIDALCLIVLLWLMWRMKKNNERKLQCRIDEYEKAKELHNTELQGAKHRVDEALSELYRTKKTLNALHKEHELACVAHDCFLLDYQKLQNAYAVLENTLSAKTKRPILIIPHDAIPKDKTMDEFVEWWNTEGCERAVNSRIDELQKSYNELADSYHALSQRWENPSKTYLVNHIIGAYNVKSITALANALGVSKSAISRMRKK